MVHPSTRSRRFSRAFEHLETRRLLAVDLVVEHDAIEPAEVGDMVTRTIRVHNLGDKVARDTLIRSSLTSELVDPVWERYEDRAKFISDPTGGRTPDFQIPISTAADGSEFAVSSIRAMGDVNGDGVEDFLLDRMRKEAGSRRWRLVAPMLVLSDVSDALDLARSSDFTSILINAQGRYPYEFTPLGDINGDGFDDIGSGPVVALGHASIGQPEFLDFAAEDAASFVRFTNVVNDHETLSGFWGIGDVDGDGLSDIVLNEPGLVVFGATEFGANGVVDVSVLDVDQTLTLECAGREGSCRYGYVNPKRASQVGDLNNDGFDDVIVGLSYVGSLVIFGGQELRGGTLHVDQPGDRGFLIPTEFTVRGLEQLGFNVRSDGGSEMVRFLEGGDFDGDGIDDLLISLHGNYCDDSCTSGDEANSDSIGGAGVIFGSANIGAGGILDLELERILRLRATVNHFDGPPLASSKDVNNDGRLDVIVSTSTVSYVVLDSDGLFDTDFGWGGRADPQRSLALHGQHGFGQFGDRDYLDVNHDGLVDQVVFQRGMATDVFLGRSPEPESTFGESDINQLVDVEPGESIVYTVRGRLRDEAIPISSSVVASTEERLGDALVDNVISPRDAVLIAVDPVTQYVGGESEVQLQLRIRNEGPSIANDVQVREDITAGLTDVTWTRSENVFPPILNLRDVNGVDGARFDGPSRVYFDRIRPPATYELPVFAKLGLQIGSLGDENDDGYDDIYAIGLTGFTVYSSQSLRFYGGPDFGRSHGDLADDAVLVRKPRITPSEILGDVNGDGYVDRITGDFNASDERGETYVTFGNASGIPEIQTHELDGANGFVIRGDRPGDLTGYSLATGDVNNDGYDDVIIGQGSDKVVAANEDEVRRAGVHVIYGRPAWTSIVSLADVDGRNGFWLDVGRDGRRHPSLVRNVTVASDFDVNGDGIDDILIGDTAGGVPVDYFANHGAVYVIFGRQQASASGTGPISDVVDLPLGAEVIYSVRGVLPEGAELAAGTVTATVSAAQIDLDPRTNTATLGEVRLLSDLDSDGTVGFSDYLVLASNFGESDASREQGDLNGDGTVDLSDFIVLARQFGGGLHE